MFTAFQMLLCTALLMIMFDAAQLRYCEKGWTKYRRSCYHVSRQKIPWYEAKVVCRIFGGHLAEIKSAREDKKVISIAARRKVFHFWIGASDDRVENKFIWSSSNSCLTYKNWHPGQPDNKNRRGEVENCLMVVKWRGKSKWNDASCGVHLNYVCEKRAYKKCRSGG